MGRKVRAVLFASAVVVALVSAGHLSVAQESAAQPARRLRTSGPPATYDDSQSAPDQDLQMWKKDLRSQKKQMVAANMDLTDAEAEKFWPVYDRYATDLAKVCDAELELVAKYSENYRTMNGDDAESYIRRRAAVEEDLMQLRLKYVPEFRRVLSGRQTALFFQIEWRLDLMINLQLAQAPKIDP